MSKTVICKNTALAALMALRRRRGWFSPSTFTSDCKFPTQKQINFIMHHDDFTINKMHVLVSGAAKISRNKNISQSYYTGPRFGVIVRADQWDPFFMPDDILITSPAFLLAQFANSWDFMDLLNLAMQLGGTYTLDNQSGEILSDRKPFLTKQQLTKMVERQSGRHWHGIDTLRKVARYFALGSASPMESKLYTMFALPTKLGGLGVSGLQLNQEINLSSRAVRIAGQNRIVVDILQPASKVVIEYDSREFHSQIEQSQRDKRRRDALQCDGYTCFSLVTRQVNDRFIFNECAYPIVKAIKGRYRNRTRAFDLKQQSLFNALKQWQF